ncbi:MAG: response regulator, partial [Clostridia bacterium]|nr:response regulator [Deltaproteobacteria bacterium]
FRGKVLVVDDDALVLTLTQTRLEGAGFTVVTRDKAIGTLQAIHEERPDVVMLDIRMPALTGTSLADLITRTKGGVPIIFHSSQNLTALQVAAQHGGAIGAISKTPDDALFLRQFDRLYERIKRRALIK